MRQKPTHLTRSVCWLVLGVCLLLLAVSATAQQVSVQPSPPGTIRLQAALPGFLGPEIKVDLVALGAGEVPLAGAGDPALAPGLPPARFEGETGLVLYQMADKPWFEGYSRYRSAPIALIADLRAARAYARTEAEQAVCSHCVVSPEAAHEILSGDQLVMRFPAALRARLEGIYTPELLDAAEQRIASVRWETSPGLRQEPALHPSLGQGEVFPGTLLHSGELTLDAIDLVVPGRTWHRLEFRRTYRSQTVGSGPLGPGWSHAYEQHLRELPDGAVELYDGTGRRETFRLENGEYQAPPGRFAALTRHSSGWTLVEASGLRRHFDRYGRLTELADAGHLSLSTGNVLRFLYDGGNGRLVRVSDMLARTLTFTYEGERLVSIKDSAGREVRYGYDGHGRLVSVTYPQPSVGEESFPEGIALRYGYETPSGDLASYLDTRDNLVSITDPAGNRVLEVVHGPDAAGRKSAVVEQRWGGGPVRLAYDFVARTTTVTDRRGGVHVYEHNVLGQATSRVDPSGAVWLAEHDDEGRLLETISPLGGSVSYAYAQGGGRRAEGDVVQVTVTPDARSEGASPLVTTLEYEQATHQPTRIVDPAGVETLIRRNEAGWAVEVIRAPGLLGESRTLIERSNHGQPTRITDALGRVRTFQYGTTMATRGYLVGEVLDPGGLALTTRYEIDAWSNVSAITDPRGVRDEFVWNELGWRVEERRAVTGAGEEAPALGYRTVWVHDASGRVLEERRPFGDGTQQTVTRFTRGTLGEVLSVERELAPGGEVIRESFAYDPALALASHTDGESAVRELVRDARGLVTEIRQGVGALAEPVTESFAYDAEGQLTSFTDARGFAWSRAYDGFGRLRESRDPLGNRTEQNHDAAGRPSESRWLDAAGVVLARESTTYDGLGRPASRGRWLLGETPRELRESYGWNAADELVSLTDVLGRVSQWERDSAGRVVESQDALGNRTELGLDAAGNVTLLREVEQIPSQPAQARETRFGVDALGQLVRREDALGNVERWTWDALGELSSYVDAEGNTTLREVDALGRLTRLMRPEGIEEIFSWDRASRIASYADAQSHTTRWLRDVLGRVERLELPDGGAYVYERDPAGNPTRITDPNGSQIAQVFDERGLLMRRESTLAAGILGPTLETFAHDGLGRLLTATAGEVNSHFSWDSLSRLLSEETLGRKVEHPLDDAGNPVELGYPSGLRLTQSFDGLNRLEQLSQQTATGLEPWAGYTFRGMERVHQQALSAQLRGEQGYDAAGRPTRLQVGLLAGGRNPFGEQQTWSPRGLKTSIARLDQNGESWLLSHDGASRLLEATISGNNPNRWSFAYDTADNLVRREQDKPKETVELPPDTSGRNRPAAVGGVALAWDANGNLIAKGDKRFAYDVHNRLTKVSTAAGVEIVSYVYDALGRRVKKVFPDGTTLETAYSGWRELEEYRNGQLRSRQSFGLGLDEIVRLELDQDGDGQLEQALVPVYDGAGNMAMLLTLDGRVAGEYSYSPFGDLLEPRVDNVPPQVEQLRIENPAGGPLRIEIDFGEQIDGLHLGTGVSNGKVILRLVPQPQAGAKDSGATQPLTIAVHQPIQDGRRARRRVIVTATDPPEAGTELELVLGVETVADLFGNALAEPFELRLTVPAAGAAAEVLLDTTNPRVDEILLRDGHLEVSFTERPDLANAAAALRIDGVAVGWELLSESYTLRSTAPLTAGTHVVRVELEAPIDLAGKGLEQAFEQSFSVAGVQPIAAIFEAPDPRVVPLTTLGNRFTFQGRPFDPETGFFYFRNRDYDPELGRFITADPLGNVDGPSSYAFAGYSPFNYGDPYGLCVGNLPCPEWARSLGGFGYQGLVTVKDVALLPVTAFQADYRARQRRLDAYLAGGYAALEEERGVQIVHMKESAKHAIPVYGTYVQAGEIVGAYEQGGAFEGGRQVFKTTFSFGGDVTLVYGAARGVQAVRGAPAAPEVSYASMLEEMQGEVAAARIGAREVTRASVDEKLGRYLLNLDHSVGGSKAKWFQDALGFTKSNADELAMQIVFDPVTAVQTEVTQFGTIFKQVISVTGTNGRTINVRFVWIRNNDGIVRLVTGLPPRKP